MPAKPFADSDAYFRGFADPPAIGRGGVLPAVAIPDSSATITGIDLTHVIHTSDVARGRPIDAGAAKGGNGGGGSGGGGSGGGGLTFAPYTAGPAIASSGFNITVTFAGTWSQSLHDIFVSAADFYARLIVGELSDVSVRNKGKTTNVDDITISASLSNIDGAGGILGQAGPTAVRTTGSLPATAIMEFDIADASDFEIAGLFDDIVLHEMGHALGFGSIWDRLGLVDTANHFTGALAQQESFELFGTRVINVETDGGAGTAGSHWDDDTYPNELMTGYIDDDNYFSTMSAGAFGDMGYKLAGNWEAVAGELVL